VEETAIWRGGGEQKLNCKGTLGPKRAARRKNGDEKKRGDHKAERAGIESEKRNVACVIEVLPPGQKNSAAGGGSKKLTGSGIGRAVGRSKRRGKGTWMS